MEASKDLAEVDDTGAPSSKRIKKRERSQNAGVDIVGTPQPDNQTEKDPTEQKGCGKHVTSLVLFRGFDLRVTDNQALTAASLDGLVVPAFVWCAAEEKHWGTQGAMQVCVKEALTELDASLGHLGLKLILRQDAESSARAVAALCTEIEATRVHLHRGHTPEAAKREQQLSEVLGQAGVSVIFHNTALLYAPEQVVTSTGFNGGHWGTLMPFVKSCQKLGQPPRPLPAPLPGSVRAPSLWPASLHIQELEMAVMPTCRSTGKLIDWGAGIRRRWRAGEGAAQRALEVFVSSANSGLQRYEAERSRADVEGATAKISVYLRTGELSPRAVYHAVREQQLPPEVTKTFARRLHWRDLSYYQLHCFPDMRERGIRRHYDATAWADGAEYEARLRAWQRGRTGYPLVDAGMRELWATGWMPQSVRMVVASFLVEFLRVSWVEGARWFHDTLVDADSAINAMMWQNAGRSGVDQWNFVISPDNASQDPSGRYTRAWCPELAALPTQFLHRPWQAPAAVLASASVVLGETYPERVVDDLASERRQSVAAVLQMRRQHPELNDAGGYDLVQIPGGAFHRVFTKQEFRLDAEGSVRPPPPRRDARGTRGGRGRGRGGGPGRGGRGGSIAGGQQRITGFFDVKPTEGGGQAQRRRGKARGATPDAVQEN